MTPAPDNPRWATGTWKWFPTPDRRILLLSIAVQLALGLVLGHSYDTRIFMSAGYLVGTGHSPYVTHDLTAIFNHVSFAAISTIGYPPPWPLALGLLYRASYAVVPSFLLYNLALKLPVIAANVGLAYLVAATLRSLGTPVAVSRRAWIFLLLNPFLLYFGAAWGQIDTVVVLLALAALVLLYGRRRDASAAVLALAFCCKPTVLPILPVALVYLLGRSTRRTIRYAAVFVAGVLVLYVLPFFVFGWGTSAVVHGANRHFVMSGTMSYTTVVRLFRDPLLMQGRWWLLGLAWIPALAIGIVALRRRDHDFGDLLKMSVGLLLIVFLTRTWLAEPDVVLILPLVLILTATGELDRRALTAVWVIPLVFTVFNASPLQLLWAAFPETSERALGFAAHYGDATLIARAVLVVVWQIVGWWIVVTCYRRGPARLREAAPDATGAPAP